MKTLLTLIAVAALTGCASGLKGTGTITIGPDGEIIIGGTWTLPTDTSARAVPGPKADIHLHAWTLTGGQARTNKNGTVTVVGPATILLVK
jgi:uncharacterized lipoprotein YmbA